jgi:hypothetical protein
VLGTWEAINNCSFYWASGRNGPDCSPLEPCHSTPAFRDLGLLPCAPFHLCRPWFLYSHFLSIPSPSSLSDHHIPGTSGCLQTLEKDGLDTLFHFLQPQKNGGNNPHCPRRWTDYKYKGVFAVALHTQDANTRSHTLYNFLECKVLFSTCFVDEEAQRG